VGNLGGLRRERSDFCADQLAQHGDALLDALRCHRHERQAQGVATRRIGIERRARHERHVARDGLFQQRHRVDAFRHFHPDEHAAFRAVPVHASRHVARERVEHRFALLAVEVPDARDVRVEQPGLQHLIRHALRETGRVADPMPAWPARV
ncbi:hypothetical protein COLO4_01375, partial [Corchorus olitorius]